MSRRLSMATLAALALGVIGCVAGIAIEGSHGFYAAWLCAYLFWLGLPLGALTLVLVHDLTGGRWMESARPVLNAAIATMPLATVAGVPALIGLHALYPWPGATGLTNGFYLNTGFFIARYIVDIVVWNSFAAYALWLPRGLSEGIATPLTWISGVGLLLLAYTASFAAIDWVLSLDPHFWSSVFPMIAGSAWFDTGLAIVLIAVALAPTGGARREHLRDLAALFFAMVIFWAYVEFCQFLIVWEEDLASEIPWYLHRIADGWQGITWIIAIAGFFLPFFLLLWGPAKRSRIIVIAASASFLFGRLLYSWWLVIPELQHRPAWWLDLAAMLALGGAVMLRFVRQLRRASGPSLMVPGEAR